MLGTTTSRLSADARLLHRPGDPQVDGPRGRCPVVAVLLGEAKQQRHAETARCLLRPAWPALSKRAARAGCGSSGGTWTARTEAGKSPVTTGLSGRVGRCGRRRSESIPAAAQAVTPRQDSAGAPDRSKREATAPSAPRIARNYADSASLQKSRTRPRGGSSKQQRSDGTAHSCSRPPAVVWRGAA